MDRSNYWHFFECTINPIYLDFLQNHLPIFWGHPIECSSEVLVSTEWCSSTLLSRYSDFLEQYSNHWIGWGEPVASEIIGSHSFWLLLYVRDAVYQEAPTTKLDMTDRVRRICQAITPQIFREVLWNFRHRLNLYLENNGAHFEHLIPRVMRNDD